MIGGTRFQRALIVGLLALSCSPALAGRGVTESHGRLPQVTTIALPHGETKAPWGWADFCTRHHDDCDVDTVLVKVEALGPGVCHEGYQSCFFRRLENGEWKVSEARTYDPGKVYGN